MCVFNLFDCLLDLQIFFIAIRIVLVLPHGLVQAVVESPMNHVLHTHRKSYNYKKKYQYI